MSSGKKLTKTQRTELIKKANKRLSKRLVRCDKCFSPRGTLTVKPHIDEIWYHEDITFVKEGVNLPCKGCKNIRFLSLGEISYDFLKREFDIGHEFYVLLKEDKWNALISVDLNKDITIDSKGDLVFK